MKVKFLLLILSLILSFGVFQTSVFASEVEASFDETISELITTLETYLNSKLPSLDGATKTGIISYCKEKLSDETYIEDIQKNPMFMRMMGLYGSLGRANTYGDKEGYPDVIKDFHNLSEGARNNVLSELKLAFEGIGLKTSVNSYVLSITTSGGAKIGSITFNMPAEEPALTLEDKPQESPPAADAPEAEVKPQQEAPKDEMPLQDKPKITEESKAEKSEPIKAEPVSNESVSSEDEPEMEDEKSDETNPISITEEHKEEPEPTSEEISENEDQNTPSQEESKNDEKAIEEQTANANTTVYIVIAVIVVIAGIVIYRYFKTKS